MGRSYPAAASQAERAENNQIGDRRQRSACVSFQTITGMNNLKNTACTCRKQKTGISLKPHNASKKPSREEKEAGRQSTTPKIRPPEECTNHNTHRIKNPHPTCRLPVGVDRLFQVLIPLNDTKILPPLLSRRVIFPTTTTSNTRPHKMSSI